MRIEYCWKIDSYSEWQFVRVAPPFTVFHYEIKWSKRLTQQYNHLILNMPCYSSTRTNTNSYGLAARQLKAQKDKRYRDFTKKCLYRFLGLCRFWVIRIWRFCRQVIIPNIKKAWNTHEIEEWETLVNRKTSLRKLWLYLLKYSFLFVFLSQALHYLRQILTFGPYQM